MRTLSKKVPFYGDSRLSFVVNDYEKTADRPTYLAGADQTRPHGAV